MANKHLRRSPHKYKHHDWIWWYEEPKGIKVLAEITDGAGNHAGTRSVTISWAALRAAISRKDRKECDS